jgi:thiol-disulfide isomerase/thioredoxin
MELLPLLAILVQTLGGQSIDALQAPTGTKAIVYVFTSTDCPVSNRYAPEIKRIEKTFAPRGVIFRLVYPGRMETTDAIREHMAAFAYGKLEAVRDSALALVGFTGATITPEVAVIVDGKVVYRGRIDDRFVELGVERPKPTVHDLSDALTAIFEGRQIPRPTTQAVGCYIADLAR